MFDDPYKYVRDILINSQEVTNIVPASHIFNVFVPEGSKAAAPIIRISVIDMSDVEFADGQIYASAFQVQIDIWQKTGLLTTGNLIKRLLKEHGFGFIDSLEPHIETVATNVTLYRDARRFFIAKELEPNEIY